MNIRSIIIDDEPNNVENLQLIMAAHCPQVELIATAFSAADGIAAIKTHRPDLVFLDIQMPEASGFDVLKAFAMVDFEIIFITAHDQYGIQAIKFSALDYLLKPINISELKLAINKAIEKIKSKKKDQNIENLLEYIKMGQYVSPKIALPTLNEIMYVKVSAIIRCEASNNYTAFYLDNGETVLVCKTLKEFDELLQSHKFIRSHQSHLVNLDFVKSYLKEDGGMLLLTDGAKVPISRQNKDKIKNELNKII